MPREAATPRATSRISRSKGCRRHRPCAVEVSGAVEQAHRPRRLRFEDRQRCVPPVHRGLRAGRKPQVAKGQRVADQAVRDDGQIAGAAPGSVDDSFPDGVDTGVEVGPSLAAGRFVVERQDVHAEHGVGAPADLSVVALLQALVEIDRSAGGRAQALGRHGGAGQVAGEDVGDALLGQALRQTIRLGEAAFAQRGLRGLHDASGVRGGLPVPDEKDRHAPPS